MATSPSTYPTQDPLAATHPGAQDRNATGQRQTGGYRADFSTLHLKAYTLQPPPILEASSH